MQKIEEVYFIDKNNAPQPHTIIENPTYRKNGYRITHYSMGAGTSAAPVRYHHLAVYSCNVGKIHIQVFEEHKTVKEIVLKPGEFWLRPARTLCSWYANEETIFTVISMRYDAKLIDTAKINGVCTVNNLPELEENTCKKTRVVDDDYFKLDFIQIGKNYTYEYNENSSTFITVVRGEGDFIYHGKTHHLLPEQAFHSYGDTKTTITTDKDIKVLQLIFKDSI